MTKIEDKSICSVCGGKCCLNGSCVYFPIDFNDLSFNGIMNILDQGNASIAAVIDTTPLKNDKVSKDITLYLRHREVGKDAIDLYSIHTRCSALTKDGCRYSLNERPTGGAIIIPDLYGNCRAPISGEVQLNMWLPYQKVLAKVVKARTGMSFFKKMSIDMENMFYELITERTCKGSKIHIDFLLDDFDMFIKAYPKEYSSALLRASNLDSYVRKRKKY